MKSHILKTMIILIAGAFLFSCAAAKKQLPTPFSPPDLNAKVASGNYVKKVDNFLVILDTSYSMETCYNEQKKLHLAKTVTSNMNRTIPDLKLSGGLRIFGHAWLSSQETSILYGMTDYTKAGIEERLKKIKYGGGDTPMAWAIDSATSDLISSEGDIAIIIISDGKTTGPPPVGSAEALKINFGDRVCIYTILVGNDPGGKKTMEEVAGALKCGFAVTMEDLSTGEGMADFVEKVFLTEAKEPAKEPEVIEKIVLDSIIFDLDSAVIKPEYYSVLDQAIEVLKKYSDKNIVIEGHTCSLGSDDYNMNLSSKRAFSVKKYLSGKGIDPDRLTAKGHGKQKPFADNTTKEGRRKNRRVEFLVLQ